MKSAYDDHFLPSLLNFDLRDLELNRKGLFTRHQLDQLRKLSISSDGWTIYGGLIWSNLPFICALPFLCIGVNLFPNPDWNQFVEVELVFLLFMLFVSLAVRLALYQNFRKIRQQGTASVTGYLKPVVKKQLYRRTYILQIGDQNFIITEAILMELVPFIQSTGPVYYRAYYSRAFPALLLSLEHLTEFSEI